MLDKLQFLLEKIEIHKCHGMIFCVCSYLLTAEHSVKTNEFRRLSLKIPAFVVVLVAQCAHNARVSCVPWECHIRWIRCPVLNVIKYYDGPTLHLIHLLQHLNQILRWKNIIVPQF